jgi:PAS domain S-box-containing protein
MKFWSTLLRSPASEAPAGSGGGPSERIRQLEAENAELKRIEQEFQASQQLLRGIVDSSDDAIISKNLSGIITSWNRGAEKIFGYTAAEAIGQPMQMLIPPERAQEEPEILARIARGETTDHFETVRVRKDGTRINVSSTISPIRDVQGRVVGASKIARDITERKRAQDALEASERHYRSIFEQSPLPKWIYDPATLRFLAVNEAAQTHYGYSEAEFLAMTIQDIRPPGDVPALHADVAGGGGPKSSEWRHRRKDGSLIDVLVNAHNIELAGKPARLIAVQDITERKQAEGRMTAQLARLNLLHQITRAIAERQDLRSIFQVVIRTVEESLPVDFCCICLYDPADRAVTVTSVGLGSAALATELAMGENARVEIDQNGLSRCVRGQLVYEPDVTEVNFPFPQRMAQGGLRALVAAPLLVESKVFGLMIAARRGPRSFSSGECEFLKQVTEHVALASHQSQLYEALQKAYEDLRQTQQAIMQQERLRALGQMASGIAHDINNAISPVALYTESLLEDEPNLSAKARGYLTTIQHAIEDVGQTVSRMREFYRQREPQLTLTPVQLNRVVEQVADLTRARWSDMPQQRGVAIELQRDLADDLPAIAGVESEIREALINLVFNAVDAMPEGGTLTLRTRRVAGHGPPRAEIQVIDTGVGMSEETRRHCLEPFFTTKGERGTGLGLAMVYGIVQRHSAEIDIESAPGRGTTVTLRFSIPSGDLPESPTISAHDPRPANRLRLLVVDDDPLLIKSLTDILSGDGHEVTAASGGKEGIEVFRTAEKNGKPFAVVITDLGMPHVDGRQVASAIKAASPMTPVIMLTGWGQRLIEDGEVPPHVDRVMSKPPKRRELRAALAELTA